MGQYQPYIKEAPRVVSGDDPQISMEAIIYNIPWFKKLTGSLLKDLKNTNTLIGFNINTQKEGKYHPAFRAKKFIPWALNVYQNLKKPLHVIADYEYGSDTYNQFTQAYHPSSQDGLEVRIALK